jgi:hypothetical protein
MLHKKHVYENINKEQAYLLVIYLGKMMNENEMFAYTTLCVPHRISQGHRLTHLSK